MQLMQSRLEQSLSILEQAKFVEELLTVHAMTPSLTFQSLARSKGWVSMRRRSPLEEMSPAVEQILFTGKFPA